ncbi:hypothetical protein L9F63_026668, partial [Diploptera punctata]
ISRFNTTDSFSGAMSKIRYTPQSRPSDFVSAYRGYENIPEDILQQSGDLDIKLGEFFLYERCLSFIFN